MSQMQFLYSHIASLGYGLMGIKIREALERQGVVIHDDHHERQCNVICYAFTPGQVKGWHEGQYRVLLTMWEATVLPETFQETLHEFDLMLVPSRHNVELFSRFHDNVVQLPLGVDPAEWNYLPRTPPTDEFIFLVGGSGARKGIDLVHRAFVDCFSSWDGPTPKLIMKSPRIHDQFNGERITQINGRLSAEAERELYARAHCYVQPSRGEGWGLQPMQAMAQGIPTILSNAHGHAEFAHLGIGIDCTFAPSEYFIFGDAGAWWEPDYDELCQSMLDVYRNYESYLPQAKASAEHIAANFTWDLTAEKMIAAIGPERLNQPYAGGGSWQTPIPRRYLVRVTRPYEAHVNGIDYRWLPGQDYYEPADVKRILQDANTGILDRSCLQLTGEALCQI